METGWWKIKAYGSWLGVAVAILLAYLHGFALLTAYVESQDKIHLAANIYLASLFFVAIGLAAWRQWLSIRKERYANITPLLHQILHQVRDLTTYIKTKEPKGGSKDEYQQFSDNCKITFGTILDLLNAVFRSLTSTHCRTSIKLTYPKNGELYIYTLTRDAGSRQSCRTMDNARVRRDHDPLEKNIPFARLFNDKEDIWHYFCNDLTRDDNFRATSLTAYAPDYATRTPARRWRPFSKEPWPLPYRSTITCVIRQPPIDMNQALPSEVLGFLRQ